MPRMRPQARIARTPPPDRWVVPPHLRGLACQACGYFFQDGESHGELDLLTGELTCQTRTLRITNRPSRALVRYQPALDVLCRRMLER